MVFEITRDPASGDLVLAYPTSHGNRPPKRAFRAQARLLRVGGYFRFPAYLGCTPHEGAR